MINVDLKFCTVTNFEKLTHIKEICYKNNTNYMVIVKFISIFKAVEDETFSPPSSYDTFTTICELIILLNIFISPRFKILKIIVLLYVMACSLA
jgi:hypothetical protein